MNKGFLQKKAFIEYEADAWFKRNAAAIEKYSMETDATLQLLNRYQLSPRSILEIGCSGGYGANGIKQLFLDSKVSGIDPSSAAINYAKTRYKEIDFQLGTIDDLSMYGESSFDLVIIGFVFYVVDRALLFRSIAEVDRVLSDRGYLVIKDFFSEVPRKRSYHHIAGQQAFSFKNNYDQMFTSSGHYHLLVKETFNHSDGTSDATTDLQELYSISLLKKDQDAAYK